MTAMVMSLPGLSQTLGGETFAQAYAQVYLQMFLNGVSATNVTTQPFFETALGGAKSAFCTGYASCTAAVAANYGSLIKETAVSDLWNKIDAQRSWVLGRSTYGEAFNGGNGQATSINLITSKAYGNYNALFVTLQTNAWHGLTSTSNFTWGRALGTGNQVQASSSYTALDPFHESAQYGAEPFDYKFVYNLNMYYAVPFGKGQHGVVGHLIGGWTIAPLFTAQSGAPGAIGYSEGSCSGCEAFGEVTTPGVAASSADCNSNAENAVATRRSRAATRRITVMLAAPANNLIFGSASVGTALHSGIQYGLNEFANPAQVYSEFRPCVLGFDTSCEGGAGGLRGLPTWNLDAQIVKDLAIYQRTRGRPVLLHLHQHPEPLPAEHFDRQPDQPDLDSARSPARRTAPAPWSSASESASRDSSPAVPTGDRALQRFGPRFYCVAQASACRGGQRPPAGAAATAD